jgi:hypothetical protein
MYSHACPNTGVLTYVQTPVDSHACTRPRVRHSTSLAAAPTRLKVVTLTPILSRSPKTWQVNHPFPAIWLCPDPCCCEVVAKMWRRLLQHLLLLCLLRRSRKTEQERGGRTAVAVGTSPRAAGRSVSLHAKLFMLSCMCCCDVRMTCYDTFAVRTPTFGCHVVTHMACCCGRGCWRVF